MNINELDPINQSWNIVFRGGIDPNFDATAVKKIFAQSYNLSEQRSIHFFSGKEILVKKGLSRIEAERYKDILERVGLIVYLVIDEEKLVVKSKIAEEREFGASLNIAKELSRVQIDMSTDILLQENRRVAPPIFSFSTEGRFNNLTFLKVFACIIPPYIAIYLILLLEFDSLNNVPHDILLIMSSMSIFGILLFGIGLLFLIFTPVLFIRAVILRLHDLSLSSYWAIVFIILPILMAFGFFWVWRIVFALVFILSCLPSKKTMNIHGLPIASNSLFGAVVSLLVVGFAFMFIQSSSLQDKTVHIIKGAPKDTNTQTENQTEN